MHSSVGSTSDMNYQLFVRHTADGLFQGSLYGRLLSLPLPAMELVAVVFDQRRYAHGLGVGWFRTVRLLIRFGYVLRLFGFTQLRQLRL